MKKKDKEKRRLYMQGYRLANREKILAQQRKYVRANKEKIYAQNRKNYEDNKEKRRAKQREYNRANKEKKRASDGKYKQANREKILAQRCKNYEDNKEKYRAQKCKNYYDDIEKSRAQKRKWRQDNLKKERIRDRLRCLNNPRFSKKRYPNKWKEKMKILKPLTKADIDTVYGANIQYFDCLTCYLCHKPIVLNDDHLEHNVPIHRGGSNDFSNLDVAHASCNRSKGSRTAEEYWIENGYPAPRVKTRQELLEQLKEINR